MKKKKNNAVLDAESGKANYCNLINNDFDAAMKVLFEEKEGLPGKQEKQTKNDKKSK